MHQIIDIELGKVKKRLAEKEHQLELTAEAKDFLIEKGTSLEYGARPLRRAIEQYLEDPLAEDLLRGAFAGKDLVKVLLAGEGENRKLVFDAVATSEKKELVTAGK